MNKKTLASIIGAIALSAGTSFFAGRASVVSESKPSFYQGSSVHALYERKVVENDEELNRFGRHGIKITGQVIRMTDNKFILQTNGRSIQVNRGKVNDYDWNNVIKITKDNQIPLTVYTSTFGNNQAEIDMLARGRVLYSYKQ